MTVQVDAPLSHNSVQALLPARQMHPPLLLPAHTQVHNECADFYQCVDDGTVPAFDVLVTNPPYTASAPSRGSGSLFRGTTDHVERLLRFCRWVN